MKERSSVAAFFVKTDWQIFTIKNKTAINLKKLTARSSHFTL